MYTHGCGPDVQAALGVHTPEAVLLRDSRRVAERIVQSATCDTVGRVLRSGAKRCLTRRLCHTLETIDSQTEATWRGEIAILRQARIQSMPMFIQRLRDFVVHAAAAAEYFDLEP